jgi:regulator of CtrA degradation
LIDEKKKVRLDSLPRSNHGPGWEMLPAVFVDLVARSIALENRIITLDRELYGERSADDAPVENPVSQQIELLTTALGAMRKG